MREEPKFKVGDVVRNVAPLSSYHGLIGLVKDCFKEPGFGNCYAVDWFKGKHYAGTSKKIYEHALERYHGTLTDPEPVNERTQKFKVGDKVLCVNRRSVFHGFTGTITKIVWDNPGYEQEVSVAWEGRAGGQTNRMKVSGLKPAKMPLQKDDPYAELKKAKAEGKKIQISHNGGKSWSDSTANWKFPPEYYRIKPENLEPKFKVDDMVVIRGYRSPGKIMTIVTGICGNREYVVNMDGAVARVKEEDVKHYSEPLPSLQQVNRSNRGGVRVGELHVIIGRPGTGASHFMSTEVAKQKSTNQQKENTMKLELTTRHFLNGKDISEITLAQLYQTIGMAEQDIRELEKIENKPKRLVKEIEKRKADLKALVDFLDAQDAS